MDVQVRLGENVHIEDDIFWPSPQSLAKPRSLESHSNLESFSPHLEVVFSTVLDLEVVPEWSPGSGLPPRPGLPTTKSASRAHCRCKPTWVLLQWDLAGQIVRDHAVLELHEAHHHLQEIEVCKRWQICMEDQPGEHQSSPPCATCSNHPYKWLFLRSSPFETSMQMMTTPFFSWAIQSFGSSPEKRCTTTYDLTICLYLS